MSQTHDVRVRYADCDMQGVVYNAHYLTFIDDGFDCWLRDLDPRFESLGWEVMLKKAEITWEGPARLAERISIRMEPTRWGNTSFDIGFEGTVDGRAAFNAAVTYVCVDSTTYTPRAIPEQLRAHLTA